MIDLDDVDVEEIYFFPFLEGIFKQSIILFEQSFKSNPIMCCHEYFICLNGKKICICLEIHDNTEWSDELLITLAVMKIYLCKSYQNFPECFAPCMYLMALMQSYFGFIDANGCFGHSILNHSRYRCGKLR